MVAVTLALVVTAAVMAAFLGSRSSFMSTSGTAAVSDNGRFALDFLQAAVRDAGYMACNTTQRQISLLNAGSSAIYYNFGQPLGGYEATNTVSNAFTLAAAQQCHGTPVTPDASLGDWLASTGPAWGGGGLDPALAGKVIKNSDVLVVNSTLRHQFPARAWSPSIATGASSFTVQNRTTWPAGQIAVISDCAKSVVFQIQRTPNSREHDGLVRAPAGRRATTALHVSGELSRSDLK